VYSSYSHFHFFEPLSPSTRGLYGSPTRITATLFGLKTTGQATELKLEAGTNMAHSTAFMANEYSRLVGKHFRYEADAQHIVPIAIYFEADTVATNI